MDKRISRILGQLRGIQKMVKEKRDPIETLQQVSAVKKAIDALTQELVVSYLVGTVAPVKMKEVERMIERVINL